jgi:hypothetical protein
VRTAKVQATVTYWRDFPDDDGEADAVADADTHAIIAAVEALPGAHSGSVEVPEYDEVAE